MADDEEYLPYKDISELKKELVAMKGKKDISVKDLSDSVVKLSQIMSDMLEVFGAAAEQMKLEEKEYGAESKKHEMIISKLDKILDQNKTIAEGMVSLVELVGKKMTAPAKEKEEMFRPKEETLFKPRAEPSPFARPQEWQPRPEPAQRTQPMMAPPQMASPMPVSPPDFGMQMPAMEPAPSPDLELPEEPFELDEEPKKKGLFGIFKK